MCAAAEAEASYNLGRAAHRVGLLHVAVAHYERVLQLEDEAAARQAAGDALQQLSGLALAGGRQQQQQQQEQQPQDQTQALHGNEPAANAAQRQLQQQAREGGSVLQRLGQGLAREAAHNLVLIYRGSGADGLARAIMRRHLTV
jgi:hypothetical protein